MKRVLAGVTALALLAASQAGATAPLGLGDRASSGGLRGAQSAMMGGDLLGLVGDAGFAAITVGMLVIIVLAIDRNDRSTSP